MPAAGRGERLGAAVPKALVAVGGEPLLVRAVRGLFASEVVDAVVVAATPEQLDTFAAALAEFGERCRVVPGGEDRTSSVRLALEAVEPGSFDAVLVHDAARAFTPVDVVRAVVDALAAGAQAVVPVIPVADTVKVVDADGVIAATPDRSSLRAIQTPQGFAEPLLRAAHGLGDAPNATLGASNAPNATLGASATDDASLVEQLGTPVHTVPGHPHALKITTPFDLRVAESILAAQP